MINPTLIIIDMQPHFPAYYDALPGTLKEIARAKQNKSPIILVEYKFAGQSGKEILDALNGYDRITKIIKHDSDGGPFITRPGLALKHLRICGINLGMCVYSTVLGLAKRNTGDIKKIQVITNASACAYGMKYAKGMLQELSLKYPYIQVL